MMTRISFALALSLPFVACMDSTPDDELAADDATEGDASKADAPGGTYTYYFVQADLRKCLSPVCGGVFYRLANASKTKCIDGKMAERCYAASEDFTKLGLGDSGMEKVYTAMNGFGSELLVRATIGSVNWGSGIGTWAKLNATEAWIPQGPNAAEGPLAKIEDSGIRCITYPCGSLREKKLNSAVTATIAELGWDSSGADEKLIAGAQEHMAEDGLIVSGYRYTTTGPAGDAKARSVTQFWVRAHDDAQKQCVVGGCSGEICADQPMFSPCIFKPEFACYHTATCEAQADGTCGWTQTPELAACLANP
jgi:hypothetical protein